MSALARNIAGATEERIVVPPQPAPLRYELKCASWFAPTEEQRQHIDQLVYEWCQDKRARQMRGNELSGLVLLVGSGAEPTLADLASDEEDGVLCATWKQL